MIRIGTSGFSFLDWKGTVYPKTIKNENMLQYYEQELGFNTLEVNYTYYRVPSARTMDRMVKKTSDDFDFTVKCYKEMTHEIWADEKRTVIKDNEQIFDDFLEGIKPMTDSGRLGCVLAQFPVFFYPNRQNRDYILTCKERLQDVSLVIEFRNKAWFKDWTFDFLEENDLGFCCVDEPRLPRLMPYTAKSTSDIGYFRLHGRNENWFNAPVSERYNYLYKDAELEMIAPDVLRIRDKTKTTYVFFNNCHAGQAARNAKMMKNLMKIGEAPPKPKKGQQTLF